MTFRRDLKSCCTVSFFVSLRFRLLRMCIGVARQRISRVMKKMKRRKNGETVRDDAMRFVCVAVAY